MPEFQFDSAADFFAMGGNAAFVWFSYLAFVLVVAWNFIQPRLERKRVMRLLQARQSRQQDAGSDSTDTQQAAQQQ